MNKARTYNLLDIKEAVEIKPQDYSKAINTKEFQFVQKAVEIKPQDYSKAINTKEFQFVQKPRDGTQNWEVGGAKLPKAPSDRVTQKQKKGKGLRSKYDLA